MEVLFFLIQLKIGLALYCSYGILNLVEEKENGEMEKVHRLGCWQKDCKNKMFNGGCYPWKYLTGKAKMYKIHYEQSFFRLCRYLKQEGFVVQREPGVRGGEWGARYWIDSN